MEQEVTDQIDSELHLTIGQIRLHLYDNFGFRRVRLYYNGEELDKNNTLADYGWTRGLCGRIIVQVMRDNDEWNYLLTTLPHSRDSRQQQGMLHSGQ